MNETLPLPQSTAGKQSFDVTFNGSGGEYFKIWIVNLMLSIVTLGIYTAWAKVRTMRYFYGNTELDGAVFEYHATPLMILKSRLVAVTVFAIVLLSGHFFPLAQLYIFAILALVTPWAIWRSTVFNARMASYRNVRFSFNGKISTLYIYWLLLPLSPLLVAGVVIGLDYLFSEDASLIADISTDPITATVAVLAISGATIFAIYLLSPYIQQKLMSYYFNHHRYGQEIFQARLRAARFYIIYLNLTGVAILVTTALVLLGTGIFVFAIESLSGFATVITVLFTLVIFAGAFISKAYLQSRVRNYAFGNLGLGSDISLSSRLRAWKLLKIFTVNFFMLVFTLGLAYPWTVTRLIRYKLETISLVTEEGLDGFVTQIQTQQSALGEEISQAFDMDMGLGI